MSRLLINLLGLFRFLPLPLLRGVGACIGGLLWTVAGRRRRIVQTNLKLCFPNSDPQERDTLGKKHFVCLVQALLDRSWLWHSPEHTVRARIRVTGDVNSLELLKNLDLTKSAQPLVLFAPHFVGLDAGWTALGLESSRELITIFTQQSTPNMDNWVLAGRKRFGRVRLFRREQGVAEVVRCIKSGAALYLLPDMDFGENETVFASFYGQSAATVTSLSRFSKVARAKVLSVVTELNSAGYEVRVSSLWEDFPTGNLQTDTQRMNIELERLITDMPEQYYWVHRRFKTRPPGEASLYQ